MLLHLIITMVLFGVNNIKAASIVVDVLIV